LLNASVHNYDSLCRRISTTDPKAAITQTAYNLFDEATSVTDPLSNVTNFTDNNVGQLVTDTTVVSTANFTRSYSDDGAGNLRSMKDRNNRDTFLTYDNQYRKTSETWKTGTTTNQTYNFSYDAISNLTAATDSSLLGTNFAFTYDARNQLQLERQTAKVINSSFILDRNYDAEGKLERTAINIGGTIVPGALNSGGTISG